MRGENLGWEVTSEPLYRFLNLAPTHVETALQPLLALRLIQVHANEADGVTSFQLTEHGIAEGKRRFLDEFSPYLGKESHLECGDADCDCHAPDWDGICHTAERH